jgi:hypothetical protein
MTELREIIGIHGVPRSGTSWLGQIFNSHPDVAFRFQPLFSYAFKSYLTLNSTRSDMDNFFAGIYKSDDYFINMRDEQIHKNYPKFLKSAKQDVLVYKEVRYHYLVPHILKVHDKVKFILIVRDPLAVLASWAKAPREFNPQWNFNEEWKAAAKKNLDRPEEYYGFDKWKESSLLFMKCKQEFPDRVALISYTDLLGNTVGVTEQLMKFSGLSFDQHVIDFIRKSKSENHEDPNSVFKTKDNDTGWKGFIPKDIEEQVRKEAKQSGLTDFLG